MLIRWVIILVAATQISCNDDGKAKGKKAFLYINSVLLESEPESESKSKSKSGSGSGSDTILSAIKATKTKYECKNVSPEKRMTYRNKIMHIVMIQISDYHEATADDLYQYTAWLESIFDFIGLGLGGAGAVASESASQTYSAISSGFIGARSTLNKNILADASKYAVMTKMQALRDEARAQVIKNMRKLDNKYDLYAGMADLYNYYKAGSIREAVTSITISAQKDLDEAKKKLKDAQDNEPKGEISLSKMQFYGGGGGVIGVFIMVVLTIRYLRLRK